MKKFERASVPDWQLRKTIEDMVSQWEKGGPLRDHIAAADVMAARAALTHQVTELYRRDEIWLNDKYQVNIRRQTAENGPMGGLELVHLSIKRVDKQCVHDWRDLQRIKNELVGPECEAVELYPAESRLVDSANQYHLWCINDPTFRFGFGFNGGRLVDDSSIGGSVNRPL